MRRAMGWIVGAAALALAGCASLDEPAAAVGDEQGPGMAALLEPADVPFTPAIKTRSEVIAPHGAAATAHPLATQIAIDTLKAGGSAVDAAIAANAALGLMEPTGNGIGGDLFAIVWDPATKQLHGYNGSGRSPMDMSLDGLRERLGGADSIPPFGALPVSVPGAVDGWFALHERFGKLPMADVLEPAARYAEDGHPIAPIIAGYWERNLARFAQYERDHPGVADFAPALALYGPEAPKAGAVFKNPDLARTYRLLGQYGRDAFYGSGAPAGLAIQDTVAWAAAAELQRQGGAMTVKDFARHRGEWIDPVKADYRGYEVWELPPPGQGIAALQMLQMLAMLEPGGVGEASMALDAANLHRQIETKRLAFEDRARFYADPEFSPQPASALLSDAYASERAALIDPARAMANALHGDPAILEDGDTTYLTVADKDGMMVSLIQSNYRGMGSGVIAPGFGFMLQDRGEMFSLDPLHPNAYEPGKRPFHTIIPGFVTYLDEDGQRHPYLSFGLMGGGMQPQGHVQVLRAILDHGLDVQTAGDLPRWRHDGSCEPTATMAELKAGCGMGVVKVEARMPTAVIEGLRARGHLVEVEQAGGGFGGYQAILRYPETGFYHAATEMRKDGAAAGY